ncbi:MAG: preprotein translocase subunit SecE [Clostridia bacterium]|nr:preprotein translocase subunit SecE [Clostridia bacterium]MBQ4324129.1 preprotein translocase subunit SecE [Clostridia bacterium]
MAVKFRAKIPGWWKGLKSECGKITWCPKDKLKKNTIVVVIIIVAIAIAIGVLDFVFSSGMMLLRNLVH